MAKQGYDYHDCRAYGHAWYPANFERKPSFGIAVDFICSRCATHRRDILAISGRIISRFYTHPEGYKKAGVTRAEWREAWLKQLVRNSRAKKKEVA